MVGEVLATAIFIKYVRIGCCHKYVVDGVSLRHNPGGVGCGQLLLGVALVVFSLSLLLLLNLKSSSEADVGRTQAY